MPIPQSRDIELLQKQLIGWLAPRLDRGALTLTEFTTPTTSGFSSETFLFDVADATGAAVGRYVMRMRPNDPFPVFRSYDMSVQYECLRLVGSHTEVPVPEPLWFEPDPSVLGDEFYVMSRLDGQVPADNPPYIFGGWVSDAPAHKQRHLWEGAVGVHAGVHSLNPADHDLSFLAGQVFDGPAPPGGNAPASALDRLLASERSFYEWAAGGNDYPTVEAVWQWLMDNRPETEADPVMLWGDARIGNIMFDENINPIAVLDWEMATIGPREVDVGWLVFMHRFFAEMGAVMQVDTVPTFPDADATRTLYIEASGVDIQDLFWFQMFTAFRFLSISMRTQDRMYHYGEAEPPPNLEDGLYALALVKRDLDL